MLAALLFDGTMESELRDLSTPLELIRDGHGRYSEQTEFRNNMRPFAQELQPPSLILPHTGPSLICIFGTSTKRG